METAVEGVLVERVVLVDRITRRQQGALHATSSLPGHLVQMTVAGRALHESEGRSFETGPGLAVWFHENEEVRVRVTQAPWSFYTVNFIAPHLPPPPADRRVWHVRSETARCFQALLESWTDRAATTLVRHMRVQARLLDLLADVLPAESQPVRVDPYEHGARPGAVLLAEYLGSRLSRGVRARAGTLPRLPAFLRPHADGRPHGRSGLPARAKFTLKQRCWTMATGFGCVCYRCLTVTWPTRHRVFENGPPATRVACRSA
jgi:hypothetical protein